MYKNISKIKDKTLLEEYDKLFRLGVSSNNDKLFKYFCKLEKEIYKRKLDTGQVYFS